MQQPPQQGQSSDDEWKTNQQKTNDFRQRIIQYILKYHFIYLFL